MIFSPPAILGKLVSAGVAGTQLQKGGWGTCLYPSFTVLGLFCWQCRFVRYLLDIYWVLGGNRSLCC
jgi:hypothetical protein